MATEVYVRDEFMTDDVVQEVYKQRSCRDVMCQDCYMLWLKTTLIAGDTSQVRYVVILYLPILSFE